MPRSTGNLKLERADWRIHLIEQDLDSEPGQEIPGNSIWGSAVGQTKRRFQTLWVERFPEGTAEPRMVQLHGGGASAITGAIRPY